MKTLKIILQIINSIQTNPSSLYQIPWEDLKLCFNTELEYREELYPEVQLQSIKQLFQRQFFALDKCLAIPDVSAIISLLKEFAFGLQLLPDIEYTDTMLEQSHYNEACLNHLLNETIIVLGDSHVNFFSGNEMLTFSPIGNQINVCPNITNNPFTILHLGPCLAYTCNKTNTSMHFHEKAEFLLNNFIKPNAHIVCSLGEIDLRAHVYPQAKLQQRTYQEIINDILVEYLSFLVSLKEKGYHVYCWGPIASQREICPIDPAFPRSGTEIERNMATLYFTQQLSLLCEQHDIVFMSIFDQMITNDFLTIEKYLSADHCHLSQRALALAQPVWEKLLPL